jgi:c-di-GMP-binding flagellar brake protein YcgR
MIRHDQRRNARYEVQLPCEVMSPFRAFDKLAGVTLNMSRVGLLFYLEEAAEGRLLPQIGHAARIVVQLPDSGREPGRCIECLGRVVRLEEQDNSRRIAIEFRRHQFTDGAAGPRRN